MSTRDPKTFIWNNICALLGYSADARPSIDAVMQKTKVKVGRGSVQRLREGTSTTYLDTVTEFARALKVEVWQLLVPDLHPGDRPELDRLPLSDVVRARLLAADPGVLAQANGVLLALTKPLPEELERRDAVTIARAGAAVAYREELLGEAAPPSDPAPTATPAKRRRGPSR